MAGNWGEELLNRQNGDGGWGYGPGSSWTEPTGLAALALQTAQIAPAAVDRATDWLLRQQRTDGGWAPSPQVDESTWVTSLAVFVLRDCPGSDAAREAGLRWLAMHPGRQATFWERVSSRVTGQVIDTTPGGWPWYPGTASWLVPTVWAIAALARSKQHAAMIEQGQRFLLARQCRDAGWHHGGTLLRSEDAPSYPETTGMALIGVQGIEPHRLAKAFERAELMARSVPSSEARSWISLGLNVHGRAVPNAAGPAPRDTAGYALALLAEGAQGGRNPFRISR